MISTSAGGDQLHEHLLRIGHLRNRGGGDEADRIDVAKPGANQLAQVCGLDFGRDVAGQTLPRIPRALDNFDVLAHLNQTRIANPDELKLCPTSSLSA